MSLPSPHSNNYNLEWYQKRIRVYFIFVPSLDNVSSSYITLKSIVE